MWAGKSCILEEVGEIMESKALRVFTYTNRIKISHLGRTGGGLPAWYDFTLSADETGRFIDKLAETLGYLRTDQLKRTIDVELD